MANAYRWGKLAAVAALLGVALSGPLAVGLVNLTHPQPPWRDAALFARSFHAVQLLPYAGGLMLVGALVLLLAALHVVARGRLRVLAAAAQVFSAVFAAFILFNYAVQTTFVPELARHYDAADAPILAALTMSNPRSLAWAIEMWGWGFLGVATWLVSPVFGGAGLERAAALTFAANGPVSLAGALWTVARPGWVMTGAGLVAFGVWNLLLAAMALLALLVFRRWSRAEAGGALEIPARQAVGPATAASGVRRCPGQGRGRVRRPVASAPGRARFSSRCWVTRGWARWSAARSSLRAPMEAR